MAAIVSEAFRKPREPRASMSVLLVGGPLAGQTVVAEANTPVLRMILPEDRPNLLAGSLDKPARVGYNSVTYIVHPVIGNRETWYIGRLEHQSFDVAMAEILGHYHKTKGK